jgi:oxygen-independent coproporphyrinogen-3 oxidase
VQAVKAAGVGWAATEELSALDQARERLAMGLRVAEGVALADIAALGFSPDARQAAVMAELGFLIEDDGRLRLTDRGRLAADRVTAEISP